MLSHGEPGPTIGQHARFDARREAGQRECMSTRHSCCCNTGTNLRYIGFIPVSGIAFFQSERQPRFQRDSGSFRCRICQIKENCIICRVYCDNDRALKFVETVKRSQFAGPLPIIGIQKGITAFKISRPITQQPISDQEIRVRFCGTCFFKSAQFTQIAITQECVFCGLRGRQQ